MATKVMPPIVKQTAVHLGQHRNNIPELRVTPLSLVKKERRRRGRIKNILRGTTLKPQSKTTSSQNCCNITVNSKRRKREEQIRKSKNNFSFPPDSSALTSWSH